MAKLINIARTYFPCRKGPCLWPEILSIDVLIREYFRFNQSKSCSHVWRNKFCGLTISIDDVIFSNFLRSKKAFSKMITESSPSYRHSASSWASGSLELCGEKRENKTPVSNAAEVDGSYAWLRTTAARYVCKTEAWRHMAAGNCYSAAPDARPGWRMK